MPEGPQGTRHPDTGRFYPTREARKAPPPPPTGCPPAPSPPSLPQCTKGYIETKDQRNGAWRQRVGPGRCSVRPQLLSPDDPVRLRKQGVPLRRQDWARTWSTPNIPSVITPPSNAQQHRKKISAYKRVGGSMPSSPTLIGSKLNRDQSTLFPNAIDSYPISCEE